MFTKNYLGVHKTNLVVSYTLKVYFATNSTCSKTEAPGEILIPLELSVVV